MIRTKSVHREPAVLSSEHFARRIGVEQPLHAEPTDDTTAHLFARLHVRGAVNLPFPDITANELDQLIPSPDTRVLIYCTNNFAAAPTALPEKVARATLNHHSFATLVASSYRNVFELAPLVDVASTEIPREGDDAP